MLAIVPYVGLGLVLAFGGRAVLDGRVSLGEFVTFYGFLGMLSAAAGQVSYLTYLTASAAGSAGRIVELLDRPADGADAVSTSAPSPDGFKVRLRDVRLSHAAEAPLRGVSLELSSGETVALVGVTGAGMATVLELVGGLVAPEQGSIELGGEALGRRDLSRLRRLSAPSGVGRLFAMSVGENIAYGRPEASLDEIEEAARLARAHEFILDLTGGYDAPVGEGGRSCRAESDSASRSRVRSWPHCPMLLLDDVTSALDPRSANDVLDGLASAEVSSTRLLSTHAAAPLRLADRVVVMDGGRVIGAERTANCSRAVPSTARWSSCGNSDDGVSKGGKATTRWFDVLVELFRLLSPWRLHQATRGTTNGRRHR